MIKTSKKWIWLKRDSIVVNVYLYRQKQINYINILTTLQYILQMMLLYNYRSVKKATKYFTSSELM